MRVSWGEAVESRGEAGCGCGVRLRWPKGEGGKVPSLPLVELRAR